MSLFVVRGPFPLAFEKRKGGRSLVFDDFWAEHSDASSLANECGCYVFAIRNRTLKPIYVGRATRSFKQEAFNPSNKHKYHEGFSAYAKGTPLMYFIVHPHQKGPTNEAQIAQIEDFLIQAGVVRNPELQNVKGAQRPIWSIKGVIRSGVGKRSAAELQFRKLFNLHG
jgi:hypothetical protein